MIWSAHPLAVIPDRQEAVCSPCWVTPAAKSGDYWPTPWEGGAAKLSKESPVNLSQWKRHTESGGNKYQHIWSWKTKVVQTLTTHPNLCAAKKPQTIYTKDDTSYNQSLLGHTYDIFLIWDTFITPHDAEVKAFMVACQFRKSQFCCNSAILINTCT